MALLLVITSPAAAILAYRIGGLWLGAITAGTEIALAVLIVLFHSIQVVNAWERALVLRPGKGGWSLEGPGRYWIRPCLDEIVRVDMRKNIATLPLRKFRTRDNEEVEISGTIHFRVKDPLKVAKEVEDPFKVIAQRAENALREAVGSVTLAELLYRTQWQASKEKVRGEVAAKADNECGLDVSDLLVEIVPPPDFQKTTHNVVDMAEAEQLAAPNLANAAQALNATSHAMLLRTLLTVDRLAASNTNTVVLVVPIELLELMKKASDSIPPVC